MKKYIFFIIAFIFIFSLGVLFYFNQRIVYVENDFKNISQPMPAADIKFKYTITGNWNDFTDDPISIVTYGSPYDILISLDTKQKLEQPELLELEIFTQNESYRVNAVIEKEKSMENKNSYFLEMKNVTIPYEEGKMITVKSKIKISLNGTMREEKIEARFKCQQTIKKSLKFWDIMMGV